MFFTLFSRVFLILVLGGCVLADLAEKEKSVLLNDDAEFNENVAARSFQNFEKVWNAILNAWMNSESSANPDRPNRPAQPRDKRAADASPRAPCSCTVNYNSTADPKVLGTKCSAVCHRMTAGTKICFCNYNQTTTTTAPNGGTTPRPKCTCSTKCLGSTPTCTSSIDGFTPAVVSPETKTCNCKNAGATQYFRCTCA